MGYSRKEVKTSLKQNKYDNIMHMATYLLLVIKTSKMNVIYGLSVPLETFLSESYFYTLSFMFLSHELLLRM